MQEQNVRRPHILTLDNRKNLSLTGVCDVVGFDEETVNLTTTLGTLIVKGVNLHIQKLSLDTSEVEIDGEIYGFQYIESAEKKSFFSKLLK